METRPELIDLVGEEVAIRWTDGSEDYFPMAFLRENSPSAENVGERDVFGRKHGGAGSRDYSGVRVVGWQPVGNYAIRFDFSDGHRTGIFSFEYLKQLSRQIGS